MKYKSANILQDFEFHDAYFKFESFEDNALIINARNVNIHKSVLQNPHNTDMEISSAKITFHDLCVKSFKFVKSFSYNPVTNSYVVDQYTILKDSDAKTKLLSELKHGTRVYSFGFDDGYYLEGCGDIPYFLSYLSFDHAIIEWDEYRKPAWYEER